MPSKWDTLIPEGSDDPPVPNATRFDDNDPFEVRAGPFWSTPSSGSASEADANSFGDPLARSDTFWLRVQERHCNSANIVHGGLLMTVADLTMADAARDGNGGWVTISFSSEFVSSALLGDLLESNAWCTRRTGESLKRARSLDPEEFAVRVSQNASGARL